MHIELSSAICFNLDQSKVLSSGNGLNSTKLKEFADNNSIFDENSRELPKRVENTVRKEEIARYEQFLLYPQCFQKTC